MSLFNPMKFGISIMAVDLGRDFVEIFDSWKKKIFVSGLRNNLRRLIEKDLKALEDKK